MAETDTVTEAETKRWSNCSGESINGKGSTSGNNGSSTTPKERSVIRRTSSIVWQETRPNTPVGWTVLAAAILSAVLGYELQLQRKLTCPPWVFFQHEKDDQKQKLGSNDTMRMIYQILSSKPNGILAQPIQPSLWVGTRGTIASSMALVAGRPHYSNAKQYFRVREILTMAIDGAKLALDWEMKLSSDANDKNQIHHPKDYLMKGPITKPVILILHGVNNNSSAAYIRSLQRTLTDRGHIALCMNFRGCGGIPLNTPRGYNGAYTNDLRSVVYSLQARLALNVPVFLVGHSLGANLVAKYLGEEGLSGTLPTCVAGGACLGNPLEIHSKNNMHSPWKQLLAWGVKLDMALQWRTLRKTLMYPELRLAYWNIIKASHIHQIDEALCPVTLRNDPYYPFATSIGYRNGEEYWDDASSYRFIKHISVPLLKIIAGDDKVVYHSFQRKLTHNIMNPNIMSVETKCGGHLGWQESPPRDSSSTGNDGILSGVGPSWAGRATADFIDAAIQARDRQAAATVPVQPQPQHSLDKEEPPRERGASGINGAIPRQFIPIIPSRL